MQIAKDVEESEYRKARLQNRLIWFFTFAVPLGMFLYWLLVDASFFNADGGPPYRLAIGSGIFVNRVLYYTLKDGRKMNTVRMQKYAELRRFRLSRESARILANRNK